MDDRTKIIMLFNEGKVWDKVKKIWKDAKLPLGVIAGGAAVVGAHALLKNTKHNIKKNERNNSIKKEVPKRKHDKDVIRSLPKL